MKQYELNLTSNAYYRDKKHLIKDFANALPISFNNTTYDGNKNGNHYAKGRFSLFLNPENGLKGYKIFVGFRKEDRKDDYVKIYSKQNIMEIRKVYDILSACSLCPKVYDIFSVNINIKGSSYISYGLEMKRIIKNGKGSKDKLAIFKNRLQKVCEENNLKRLSRKDRRVIEKGGSAIGSVDVIMYEASTKADNVVFDGNDYILLDIDPVWRIS